MNVIRNINNMTVTIEDIYEELYLLSKRYVRSKIEIPNCDRDCAGCKLINLVEIKDTGRESPICTVIRDVLEDIYNRRHEI